MKRIAIITALLMSISVLASCAPNTEPTAAQAPTGTAETIPAATPAATPAPTPAPTTTPAPTETPAATPDDTDSTDDAAAMITFKPCLALDAMSVIQMHDWGGSFRDVNGIFQDALKDIPGGLNTNTYADLIDNYSLEEIEQMDFDTLATVLPNCLKTNEFIDSDTLALIKDQFNQGFQILRDLDFTNVWEENCLPLLTEQCDEYNALINSDPATSAIMADIKKIKKGVKIDGATVYLSYFLNANGGFGLTDTSYYTRMVNGKVTAGSLNSFLQLFAHELTHGFSNDKLQELYKNACETDEFLQKTKYVLFEKKNSTSYEEEFVVALAHFMSVKSGLITEDEAYSAIESDYEGCEPIALIVFDELMKLGDIPDDTNEWLCGLFENGVIKVGDIENQLTAIDPDFVQSFYDNWGSELPE